MSKPDILANVQWTPLPEPETVFNLGAPYATHEGVFELGGCKIRCFQLSDGQRVLDAADVERFFGIAPAEEAQA